MVSASRQHQFARLPSVKRPRSAFDRSHGWKGTFDAGYLIPFYVDETLPGDTFNVHVDAFARLATPLFPVMDNMYLTTMFFHVPLRLIWDNFERFMGYQRNPGDSTDFVTPKLTIPGGGLAVGTIYDYMGVPISVVPNKQMNNFFGRAHNLIWNEWFRDQNMQSSVVVDVDDGPDDPADYVLLRRGKRHDYFTSALTAPQKGPAVELPLSGNAPVLGIGKTTATFQGAIANVRESDGTLSSYANGAYFSGAGVNDIWAGEENPSAVGYPFIRADMTAVTSATINELREAITIQQMYELDARGGTRYIEMVYAHFGVLSPDARLQRPEYLGGGTTYMNISPIAQTSAATEDSPQGNLAAMGTAFIKRHGFSKSFTEHGVVIGFVVAHADLNYQQGLNRMFTRSTRFDFYDPILANLGEQAVLNQEIFVSGSSTDLSAFGYQERWAEYRYYPNITTSLFRSDAAGTLDAWHWAQDFTALPSLNSAFIVENPPVDRTIAVPSEPHIIMDAAFKMRTVRVMPMFSVPGLSRL